MGTSAIVVRQQQTTPTATPAPADPPTCCPSWRLPATPPCSTTLYDTPFAQAPVPTQANQVYVRGKKHHRGTAGSATVTLYCVQHDTVAGMFSPLLTPSNWDTSVFTVNNQKTSQVALTAAGGGVVAAQLRSGHRLGAPLSPRRWCSWPGWTAVVTRRRTSAPFNRSRVSPCWVSTSRPPRRSWRSTPRTAGCFVRQSANQDYAASAAGATWNASPDLVLYSGQAAYDTTLLKRAQSWSTQQPPTIGGPNNLHTYAATTPPTRR